MARANFVKKARKDNPCCKKGESYWWWQFPYSGKRYSKTMPFRSQLTKSEFLSTYYAILEDLESELATAEDFEAVGNAVDIAVGNIEDLQSETEDKLSNIPEQLQDSDTGQLLHDRISGCEDWVSRLQSLDLECPDTSEDSEYPEIIISDALEELKEEIRNTDPVIS